MSESTYSSDTPVLDLLASMTADSLEATSLDAPSIAMVRLAALVASDAPSVSYGLNLAVAGDAGLDADDVRGVLTAIAPIVGTSRVAAATGRIALALAVAIEVAAESDDDEVARADRPGGRKRCETTGDVVTAPTVQGLTRAQRRRRLTLGLLRAAFVTVYSSRPTTCSR